MSDSLHTPRRSAAPGPAAAAVTPSADQAREAYWSARAAELLDMNIPDDAPTASGHFGSYLP